MYRKWTASIHKWIQSQTNWEEIKNPFFQHLTNYKELYKSNTMHWSKWWEREPCFTNVQAMPNIWYLTWVCAQFACGSQHNNISNAVRCKHVYSLCYLSQTINYYYAIAPISRFIFLSFALFATRLSFVLLSVAANSYGAERERER